MVSEGLESRSDVRVIHLDVLEPRLLICPREVLSCFDHEIDEILCVSFEGLAMLRRLRKQFKGVLANRLKHPIALVRMAQKALRNERLERVDIGARHSLGRAEVATPAKIARRRKSFCSFGSRSS